MTPLKFAFETGKVIQDYKKVIVDCYQTYPKESISAILLLFKKNTMEYYYISENHNKPLLNILEPFMIERLKLNQDKLGIISIGDKGLVSCHFLFN
jgi:hypothetical protein